MSRRAGLLRRDPISVTQIISNQYDCSESLIPGPPPAAAPPSPPAPVAAPVAAVAPGATPGAPPGAPPGTPPALAKFEARFWKVGLLIMSASPEGSPAGGLAGP